MHQSYHLELSLLSVADSHNLQSAAERVIANRGRPGIDDMTVDSLDIKHELPRLREQILSKTVQPSPLRHVSIPKSSGHARQLLIPTVIDRWVQLAILQILQPLFESHFSPFSFGFRPQKNTYLAVLQAKHYVSQGYLYVVDIDFKNFFDDVCHKRLLTLLADYQVDLNLIRLIHQLVAAPIQQNQTLIKRTKGLPQGGPLSPILANLYLDQLDKALTARGYLFCRYADDCNVYVTSMNEGITAFKFIEEFATNELQLSINTEKSGIFHISEREFLGFQLSTEHIYMSPRKKIHLKQHICRIVSKSKNHQHNWKRIYAKFQEKMNYYSPLLSQNELNELHEFLIRTWQIKHKVSV